MEECKTLKTIILAIIGVLTITAVYAGQITLAWDANTEEDLAGYRIYHGRLSRFETIGSMAAWCKKYEPTNEKCIAEWQDLCEKYGAYGSEKADPACHSQLFTYETITDVKNVTEYTLTDFLEGVTYFFAAEAYDTDGNKSAFSIELTHKFTYEDPKPVKNFSGFRHIPAPEELKVTDKADGPVIEHKENKTP